MNHIKYLIFVLLCGWCTQASHAASFSVVNLDALGSGLNDTTAFTPTGGNNASTLGQARLTVLNEAGRLWGQRLTSAQTIVIEASFAAQTCTANSATLASAGPTVFFTLSSQPAVLLPAALADALTGQNNNAHNDISITINSAIGSGAGCLGGRSFYLGLDHAAGSNVDLLNVLLHEIGHGLGFLSLTDSTGAPYIAGKFSAFDQFVYSELLGKFWPAMTDSERHNAGISSSALTFNAAAVNAHISGYTLTTGLSSPGGHLRLYAPPTYANGSSVSHWDTVANPDLLMEPFIHSNPLGLTDMTGCVLRDIGWSNARCPDDGVNNTPPTAPSQTVSINEDTPVQITLLGNDADGAGALTYSVVTNPTKGTLTLPVSMTSTAGITLTYTPDNNVNGVDGFTYQVSDGTDVSAVGTMTINIAAINDAPTAAARTLSTNQNGSLTMTLVGSDVEGSSLTYRIVTSPNHGTLTGSGNQRVYQPENNFIGSDSFTYLVNDGALDSTPATVTIDVNPTVSSAAAPSSSSGGGGGAWNACWLLTLMALVLFRTNFSGLAARAVI